MSKNFVIFSMSLLSPKAQPSEYTADNGAFKATTLYTNETALKYIDWKLKQQQQRVDKVYAFVTDKVRESTLDGFKEKFSKYNFPIHDVPLLSNGDLQGSFASISNMFDVLEQNIANDKPQDIVIHFDMTGGFRHGAMLMLALIQMLNYRGFKIGMILYTNYDKHVVESANELMQMFTLISGADEFTSFGSVEQIHKYFKHRQDISKPLRELLNAMENLSEMIKICVNYQDMSHALFSLKEKLNAYKEYLAKHGEHNIDDSELFFSKLVSTIENEYRFILPETEDDANLPKIIEWCAKKGFVQQSLVFYTEWLPQYLTDKGLLWAYDRAKQICMENKLSYKSWQSYLLQSYRERIPEDWKSKPTNKQINFGKELKTYLEQHRRQTLTIKEIRHQLGGKNKNFDNFLLDLDLFIQTTNETNFVQNILQLSDENLIKLILTKNVQKNTTFENFLATRIKREKSALKLIVSELTGWGQKALNEMFAEQTTAEQTEKNQKRDARDLEREQMFKYLLDTQKIKTTLPQENLIRFAQNYSRYIDQWRNEISHAHSSSTDKQQNKNIVDAIVSSVNLLNLYNK